MCLAEAPAQNRKILRISIYQPPANGAVTGHNPVAIQGLLANPERRRALGDKHTESLERPLVHQQFNSLPRRVPALGMLLVYSPLTAAEVRALLALGAIPDFFRHST